MDEHIHHTPREGVEVWAWDGDTPPPEIAREISALEAIAAAESTIAEEANRMRIARIIRGARLARFVLPRLGVDCWGALLEELTLDEQRELKLLLAAAGYVISDDGRAIAPPDDTAR